MVQPVAIADLSPALQDYLEAVLALVETDRVARVSAIARRLGVGKPAVTSALKALAGKELVNYEAYQFITLTDEGRRIAREVARRHRVLREFLSEILGFEPEKAEDNACRMEHHMDRAVLDRIGDLTDFIRAEADGDDWIGRFQKAAARRGREESDA